MLIQVINLYVRNMTTTISKQQTTIKNKTQLHDAFDNQLAHIALIEDYLVNLLQSHAMINPHAIEGMTLILSQTKTTLMDIGNIIKSEYDIKNSEITAKPIQQDTQHLNHTDIKTEDE